MNSPINTLGVGRLYEDALQVGLYSHGDSMQISGSSMPRSLSPNYNIQPVKNGYLVTVVADIYVAESFDNLVDVLKLIGVKAQITA